jgi:hypothetical protein
MAKVLTNVKPMKKKLKVLIKKILMLMLIYTLGLSSLGCPNFIDTVIHTADWHIEMRNNSSIGINLLYNFIPEHLTETEPFLRFLEFNIQREHSQNTLIYTSRNVKKLSSFISEITVSDSKNNKIIHLSGEDIDDKIMLIEEIDTHVYLYQFEINNEDIFQHPY